MYKNKAVRYTMFGLLYFSQGTVLGYFTALNALYLLSKGVSMTDVGIFALIALIPFVIKIFLGMLSDNVNLLGLGHRKPYILLGVGTLFRVDMAVPFVVVIAFLAVSEAKERKRNLAWGLGTLAFFLVGQTLFRLV